MDNKEGTVIGVGCLAIGCLCYFLNQFQQERDNIKAKRNALSNACKASNEKKHQIDYNTLKKSGERIPVFLPQIDQYQLEQDTYKKYTRQRRVQKFQNQQEADYFEEDQSGGRFSIKDKFNNQTVTVDINNCHIHRDILEEKRQNNIVFQQNKRKKAMYESTTLKIADNKGLRLALYGALGYSISEQKFIVQPEFLLPSFEDKSMTIEKMVSFWDDKIYTITFKKMVLILTIGAFTYFSIYRPLKAIIMRYRNKFVEINKSEYEYFRQKKNFASRERSGLICEICLTNNVNMVYECGHLGICEQCHNHQVDKKCKICNKTSRKFMKIFL